MNSPQKWNIYQQEYWNKIAPNYDSLYESKWSIAENQQLAEQLQQLQNFNNTCNVLDLGCGTGLGFEICSRIAPKGFRYSGLDIASEMVAVGREKWSNASFFIGDMSNLSMFMPESFDIVISLFTAFSYSDKPIQVLKEIHRVVRQGGEVFVSYLSRYSLRRLCRLKFSNIEYYNTRYNDNIEKAPAFVYTQRELQSMIERAGFITKTTFGQGVFSGVFENTILWRTDYELAKYFPNLCHLQNIYAVKG